MRLRALSVAIASSLVLASCAGGLGQVREQTQAVETKPIPDSARVSGCLHTQRDLTVSWRERRYWCGNDLRRDALQDQNVRSFDGGGTHPKRSERGTAGHLPQRPLAAASGSDAASETRLMVAAAGQDDTMVQYLSLLHQAAVSQDVRSVSRPASKSDAARVPVSGNTRIPFARTREVLGPQGTRQVLSLLPAVREARKVTLLGLYEADELAKVEAGSQREERFSVGRSLSVRELWRKHGLDVSKVTILHHSKERNGSHVEVEIDD